MSFRGVPVREALDSALVALSAAGVDSPRLDAEVLLAHALGVDRTALALDPGREVTGDAVQRFQQLVRRRSAGREPIAYLLGSKGFRHIDLHVDERVLIPRPDTEALVEAALEALPEGAAVVDVGTGSGAVALALKHERPDLRVTATDVSAAALEVARDNAARLGLDVAFARADLLDGVDGPFDAVVSNPPYVAESERAALAPEIVRHEPATALFGGADGLEVVRRLVATVPAETAFVALEVGATQAGAVRALFKTGWTTGTRRDLSGHERVVTARR